MNQMGLWLVFALFIFGMMILDLGVLNRKAHVPSLKESLLWCGLWFSLAMVFNVVIYFWKGQEQALLFLTGYLVEESLSVDNLFVFLMIFSYFQVQTKHQHKVLFWGIIGAMLMRGIFIATGIALIENVHWIIYIFGSFLVFTGLKMAQGTERKLEPQKNPIIKLFKRFMPVTETYVEDKFFVRHRGALCATPLFIVLLVVETTDVIFAVDSIPAILAISTDPFIVYTSNIFAILGLRALFFALAGFMRLFHYLNYGLAIILVFIGGKMLLTDIYKMPSGLALGIVANILAFSVLASMVWKPKGENGAQPKHAQHPAQEDGEAALRK